MSTERADQLISMRANDKPLSVSFNCQFISPVVICRRQLLAPSQSCCKITSVISPPRLIFSMKRHTSIIMAAFMYQSMFCTSLLCIVGTFAVFTCRTMVDHFPQTTPEQTLWGARPKAEISRSGLSQSVIRTKVSSV
jgi:hypothetical protein